MVSTLSQSRQEPTAIPASNKTTQPSVVGSVLLHNINWEILERLDSDLTETGAKLVYLDGSLEIMSPLSDAHESPKKTLAQILEAYMRFKGIRFYAKGSATIGMKSLGARKEPDESYCIGERKQVPDLALEITVTRGGIDVLEIYRRIGISEVWLWEDGVISIYGLRESGYELISNSELLPELDIRSLEFHTRMSDQYDAINAFIQSLGS